MYEKDGEKYFVVDGHTHFWDASPENWVEGQEQYAKGWIECFYGYHQLGPEEYYWPMEKYQKYSEETIMKDLFEDGYVDKAIFQPIYLKSWYKEGFNSIEQDATLAEKYPDKFILNGRFDPRDGGEGLRELERQHERYGIKGVKCYTAESGSAASALRADGAGEHRGQRGAVPRASGDALQLTTGRGGRDLKAARLHRYDDSIPKDSLKVEDIDEPKIEGPLDVIVRIGAAGLCRTDIHVIEGQWAPIHDPDGSLLPYTLGHENAGWVEEVGPGVTNVSVGDTVILHPLMTCGLCRACRAGDDMHCEYGEFPGLSRDGGFADLIKTNARAVVKLDPVLEPKDIAALADAGLTAYHAVRKSVPYLYAGTKAVVIGAGGLGHIGIQCLKALTPAEIIVTDPNENALALAKEWGADENVKVEDGYLDTVLEMTNGKGAEVVFDYVGERGAEDEAWQMTRPGGYHFVIGYGGTVEIPTIDIISTERSVVGNLVGTYNDLAELMNLTARGLVTLHTSTYPLDAINDAIQDLNNGNLQGRGILIPDAASS